MVRTTPSILSPLEQVRKRNTKVDIVDDKAAPAKPGVVTIKITLSPADQKLLSDLLESEQDFIDSPAFYEDDAVLKIYDEPAEIPKPDTSWYHPVMDDLSGRTRTVKTAQQIILTGAQEKVLFHQFNYARYRIWKLQQEVWATTLRKPTPAQAAEILLVPPLRRDPSANCQHEPGPGAGDGQAHPHVRGGLCRSGL